MKSRITSMSKFEMSDADSAISMICGFPKGSDGLICGFVPDHEGLHSWEQPETVNHPAHYNANPSGVECITVVEWMTFNIGNAIKYLWRVFEKGDPVENLEKARWYIDREIDRLRRPS